MKNVSIIAIPVFVVILILAGVFVWKMVTPPKEVTSTSQGQYPNSLDNATGNKPSNPFSILFGGKAASTPIPTPTPASAAAMNSDLQTLVDDGGVADFSTLQTQVSGL